MSKVCKTVNISSGGYAIDTMTTIEDAGAIIKAIMAAGYTKEDIEQEKIIFEEEPRRIKMMPDLSMGVSNTSYAVFHIMHNQKECGDCARSTPWGLCTDAGNPSICRDKKFCDICRDVGSFCI